MRKNLQLCGILKPGEEGTEELVERFGDALVCVRFWYDEERGVMLKTAEVIEARRSGTRRRRRGMPGARIPRIKD